MKPTCLFPCLIGLVFFLGCGRPPVTAVVRGRIMLGEDSLPGGLIRFHRADDMSRWSGGTIEADGGYTVPDAPLGRCAVTIDTSNLKNLPAPRRLPVGPGTPSPPGTPDASAPQAAYRLIAKKYATVESSPLVAEVKPGTNTLDFQVE